MAGALKQAIAVVQGLEVDPKAMRRNIEMTGGRQIGLGLAAQSIDVERSLAAAPVRAAAPARAFREPRPHGATAAELARHTEFVAALNQPLWHDSP